jgi:hypothetical protein
MGTERLLLKNSSLPAKCRQGTVLASPGPALECCLPSFGASPDQDKSLVSPQVVSGMSSTAVSSVLPPVLWLYHMCDILPRPCSTGAGHTCPVFAAVAAAAPGPSAGSEVFPTTHCWGLDTHSRLSFVEFPSQELDRASIHKSLSVRGYTDHLTQPVTKL